MWSAHRSWRSPVAGHWPERQLTTSERQHNLLSTYSACVFHKLFIHVCHLLCAQPYYILLFSIYFLFSLFALKHKYLFEAPRAETIQNVEQILIALCLLTNCIVGARRAWFRSWLLCCQKFQLKCTRFVATSIWATIISAFICNGSKFFILSFPG